MDPEQIREARRTAVAALRLETQGRGAEVARLIRESEDVEAVAMSLTNLGSSYIVALCAERGIRPSEIFDKLAAWLTTEDGGRPGTELG